MNGQSFTPRLRERMNENMEFPGATGEYIEWVQIIQAEVSESAKNPFIKKEERGKVKYYRDTYAEHPEDRENIEYCVQMEGEDALLTLTELYDSMKSLGFDLSYFRLPIVDEKAPRDIDFDDALNAMRQTDPDSACIFNCQMG